MFPRLMMRRLMLASALSAGVAPAVVTPAEAGTWTYTGPRGGTATVNHWGGPGSWGRGPCCYGGGVAAGAVAGLAAGTAVGIAAAAPPVVDAPAPYFVP